MPSENEDSKSKLKIVYVVTSNGSDAYADMAMVSAVSARITNPNATICIACDRETASSLLVAKHRLLDVSDSLLEFRTPAGPPEFRNRWIKTQLRNLLVGNFLFLDSDTLVRGSLTELTQTKHAFSAVANHNSVLPAGQISADDLLHFQAMKWNAPDSTYFNGGVWYVLDTPDASRLFGSWFRLWMDGYRKTRRTRDQPSLYQALKVEALTPRCLHESYNKQLAMTDGDSSQALVWHFYSSQTNLSPTVLDTLLRIARRSKFQFLHKKIGQAIRYCRPWPNLGPIAVHLEEHYSRLTLSRPAKLWLMNHRRESLRALISELGRLKL